MKRLTTLSLIAIAAAAMLAVPAEAQTRGGSNSRGGSGGGNGRSSGGTRPSSSMSAPSSRTRSAGQSGNTKSVGSASRSSQPAQSSAQPQRSHSKQRTAPQAQPKVQPQAQPRTQQPKAQPQTQPRTQQPKAQPQTQPRTQQSKAQQPSQQPRAQQPRAQQPPKSEAQPQRSQPQRSTQPRRSGGNVREQRPDMGARREAPKSVRERPGTPRDFERGREPRHIKTRPERGRDIKRVPPRQRKPMPYGRAVRFGDGGRHYYGYRVSYLPSRYVRVDYWGVPYYLLDGIYYRYYRGHYYVSRPPFGVLFDPVLDNLIYTACSFAYYYDVYNTYRTINDNARLIASQNETIAANNATIARQNADIALNSERAAQSFLEADRLGLVQSYADAATEYFYQDGVFFTKDKSGQYVTIVPPAGALVSELPDDYDTVTLDGEEYYKVDDTIFKLTIVDGAPFFEVLGQLTGELAQQYDLYDSL